MRLGTQAQWFVLSFVNSNMKHVLVFFHFSYFSMKHLSLPVPVNELFAFDLQLLEMEQAEKNMMLKLIDAENSFEYEIQVTSEEYYKACNDINFAGKLLEDARTAYPSVQKCIFDENADTQGPECSTPHRSYIWGEKDTHFFLSLYKDLTINGEIILNKHLWEKISKEMENNGYTVNVKQCATKMDSMKRTYKAIKDHNSQSGNAPKKNWPYLEAMDELFATKAWAKPLSTVSSIPRHEDKEVDEALDTHTPKKGLFSRKRIRHDEGLENFMKLRKEEKKETQRRHEEKMKRLDRMNDLLEKLVSKKD